MKIIVFILVLALQRLVSNAGRSDAIGASAEVQLSPADVTVAEAPAGCVVLTGRHGFTCPLAKIPAGSAVAILRFAISVGQFARGAVGATRPVRGDGIGREGGEYPRLNGGRKC